MAQLIIHRELILLSAYLFRAEFDIIQDVS